MAQTFSHAFEHSDMFMKSPYLKRMASEQSSLYAQATMRGGGRSGIALSAGFRWTLGGKIKENKNKNVKPVKDTVKPTTPKATGTELPKAEFNIRDVQDDINLENTLPQQTPAGDNLSGNAPKQKTVIKSLNKNANYRNINKYLSMVDNSDVE